MAHRRKETLLNRLDRQSLTSLGLGTLVVIIVGLLIFNYFSKIKQAPVPTEEIVTEEKVEKEEKVEEKPSFEFKPTELPVEHTVAKGEHLWGLAKRYYDDGYKWVEIARENKLVNPDLIYPGNKLTVPKLERAVKPEERVEEKIEALGGKIEGDEYTVQRGDDLCKIAIRAYGDCTKGWEIARVNNLANPHLIHAGNVLKLPRD